MGLELAALRLNPARRPAVSMCYDSAGKAQIIIAGFGSPHGDDQVGWRVAATLACRANLPARVIAVYEPTEILAALRGCDQLIVVDACHTGKVSGSITHLNWPDPRLSTAHFRSSHSLGVAEVLALAESLGDLPSTVDVFGIEVQDCSPGGGITKSVLRAVAEVEMQVLGTLGEPRHA